MPNASVAKPDTALEDAASIVEDYLRFHMIPDPDAARVYVAPDFSITFTGGRKFKDPAEATEFNASRYRWVKKQFEQFDVVAGGDREETIVYALGTLYGEWPDGTPFSGNRYVVKRGKIVKMDVWNDSAEILLARARLAAM
jgi:hypothetical protein